MKKTLLITGAGGRIGTQIVPLLRPKYRLKLLDFKPIIPEDDDEIITGDFRDVKLLESALKNTDAILHLAAISDEDDFYTKLLPVNIEGIYTLFDVSRKYGIKKIVFASTCQTVLNYPNSEYIKVDMPVRPYNLYACTKIFGENVGRYYSDKYGMSVICLRIGWFQPYDSELLKDSEIKRRWCSPKDFCQIVEKSIETKLKYGIFFAISQNKDLYWDIEETKNKLDYKPEHYE